MEWRMPAKRLPPQGKIGVRVGWNTHVIRFQDSNVRGGVRGMDPDRTEASAFRHGLGGPPKKLADNASLKRAGSDDIGSSSAPWSGQLGEVGATGGNPNG